MHVCARARAGLTIVKTRLILSQLTGQMNDARLNVSIALTAASYGAITANHVEAKSFIKSTPSGDKIVGAIVRDTIKNEEFSVKAKVIINATGPFSGM